MMMMTDHNDNFDDDNSNGNDRNSDPLLNDQLPDDIDEQLDEGH